MIIVPLKEGRKYRESLKEIQEKIRKNRYCKRIERSSGFHKTIST